MKQAYWSLQIHRSCMKKIAAVLFALGTHSTTVAMPEWRVVLTPSSNVVTVPNLPAPGTYELSLPGPIIGDGAAANANFAVRLLSSGDINLWRERAGVLNPYAEVGTTGITGPSRSGAEATHVFRRITSQSTATVETDSDAEDARVFSAYAGDPTLPFSSATVGVWTRGIGGNAANNNEIARVGTDGSLGPNIGAGWTFTSGNVNFGLIHALPNGNVLIQATVLTSAQPNLPFGSIVRYQPGLGNTPCTVANSTNPAWAPGVLGNDYFESYRYASSSPRGEVFAYGNAARQMPITVRNGIWQFCSGAPQVKVLSETVGALGPNIPGSASAVFTRLFPNIGPSTAGSFYFTGVSTNTPTFKGVFHHSNGQNRPVLLNGVEGALGPQVPGFVFDTILDYDPISAGRYAIVRATIRPVGGGGSISGIWRLRPDASPEPVAIVDSTTVIPAPGRVWRDVDLFGIFENGDVMLQVNTTNPPSLLPALSVWRARLGRAPEEILKVGDMVSVPTTSGVVQRMVLSISRPGGGSAALREYGGDDSWLSASGSALVQVGIQPSTTVPTTISPWVRAQVTNIDVNFQNGFE
jgi:hypothetical protein